MLLWMEVSHKETHGVRTMLKAMVNEELTAGCSLLRHMSPKGTLLILFFPVEDLARNFEKFGGTGLVIATSIKNNFQNMAYRGIK